MYNPNNAKIPGGFGCEVRVVEEVSLNKEVEDREETVRGTVRSTEVDVEKLDADQDALRRRNKD